MANPILLVVALTALAACITDAQTTSCLSGGSCQGTLARQSPIVRWNLQSFLLILLTGYELTVCASTGYYDTAADSLTLKCPTVSGTLARYFKT